MRSKKLILVFAVLGVFLSFCGSTHAVKNNEETCKLIRQDFDIDVNSLQPFNSELADFMNSEHDFDAIIIKIQSGADEPSTLQRWTVTNSSELLKTKMTDNLKNAEKVKSIDIQELDRLIGEIDKGGFLYICPLAMDTDTNLFLIKKKGDVLFKLSSAEGYKSLDEKYLEQVKGAAAVFDLLQNANRFLSK
jgi:hypothetical protein